VKALVVRQPWASLIAHGIKTIETRGFAPRTSIEPGDQIAIVAGKAVPSAGTQGDEIGGWRVVRPRSAKWMSGAPNHPYLSADSGQVRPCPLGAVVAVVTFDEALPCVEANPVNLDLGGGPPHWNGSERLLVDGRTDRMWHVTGRKGSDGLPEITDQLPLGDFTPGRYGWLLSNPQRLTHPVPCPAIRPDGSRTVMQGVFTLPDDVLEQVTPQLAREGSERT